jgi:phospholipase C
MLTREQLLGSVDTIVVLMMENRSFDHYLGRLRGDGAYPAAAQVDGLRGEESNPDPQGAPVRAYKLGTFTAEDPPHNWDACHKQWNQGKNDGFVRVHAGAHQTEVMGYYERGQIPFYYALADRYTVCERWFASVMGPTWPNRFYLHSATSQGKKDNTPFVSGGPDTIWERLKDRGLAGKNYSNSIAAFYTGGYLGKALSGKSPVVKMDEFYKDARSGNLPPFSIIDPDFLSSDDHPAHDIRLGQAFIASVFQALSQSPQWPRCLFILTYDEHGGFFDHVPPPAAFDPDPAFAQLGFRVPTIIAGPTVRRGHVSATVFDHVSVPATASARFGLRSLGPRMERTADISPCIDPRLVNKPAPPPTDLPKVQVSRGEVERLVAREAVTSQPELSRLMARGQIPASLIDDRPQRERLQSWLRTAVALGAVEMID